MATLKREVPPLELWCCSGSHIICWSLVRACCNAWFQLWVSLCASNILMKDRTLLASQDAYNFVALEVSVHAWQGVNRCLLLISNHSWLHQHQFILRFIYFSRDSRAVDVLKLLVWRIEFARSNHFFRGPRIWVYGFHLPVFADMDACSVIVDLLLWICTLKPLCGCININLFCDSSIFSGTLER